MTQKVLSALSPPPMTTTQRDAIPAGRRPKGASIFNTTTNRHETNLGSDASPIWLPIGGPIDVQTIAGAFEGYSSNFAGPGGNAQIWADLGSTIPLRLTFTPTVNAWWDLNLNVGLVEKVDANYNYMYAALNVSPADADGIGSAFHLLTQHASVQQFDHRVVRRAFKLNANVTYTANGFFTGSSGGTWRYYLGPNHLWLNGIAWVR